MRASVAKRGKSARRKCNVFKFRRAAWEMEEIRAIAECSGWGNFYQFIAGALFEYARKYEAILGLAARDAVKLDRAARLAIHRQQREIGKALSNTGILRLHRN